MRTVREKVVLNVLRRLRDPVVPKGTTLLFGYHAKQKFDCVETFAKVRSRKARSLHSAQGDAVTFSKVFCVKVFGRED